mgnify:CR=1 FL=1
MLAGTVSIFRCSALLTHCFPRAEQIAAQYAGPAVVLSWVLAGIGCVFSGLSYAEMSARVPSAGSSYAYTFFAMGELPAVIAGWCVALEVSLHAAISATLAIACSGSVCTVRHLRRCGRALVGRQSVRMVVRHARLRAARLDAPLRVRWHRLRRSSQSFVSRQRCSDVSVMAGLMQAMCVAIMLGGLKLGKITVNFFTGLKVRARLPCLLGDALVS